MITMILFTLFVILPFIVVAGLYGADHPKADLLLNGLLIGLLIYLFVLLGICVAC